MLLHIHCSTYHTCAVTVNASGYCWGHGGWGQLGLGTYYSSYGVPRPVKGGFAWASIRTAAQSTCGQTTAGALYCWGYNRDTMFGLTGTYYLMPKIWLSGTNFSAFDVANSAVFGVQSNGTIWSRGSNALGLLGAGLNPASVATSRTPRQVPAPYAGGAWLLVSAQTFHACAFSSNYTLSCWGRGTTGALGTGNLTNAWSPVPVSPPPLPWNNVQVGMYYTCASNKTVAPAGPSTPGCTSIVKLRNGNHNVTITWVPPTDTGGRAITGYRITCTSPLGVTGTSEWHVCMQCIKVNPLVQVINLAAFLNASQRPSLRR